VTRRTVPICGSCWVDQYGQREPTVLKDPETELCHFCELPTRAGIYVRVNGG
jgi:hypothetical protein